jgi:hypothetical protein
MVRNFSSAQYNDTASLRLLGQFSSRPVHFFRSFLTLNPLDCRADSWYRTCFCIRVVDAMTKWRRGSSLADFEDLLSTDRFLYQQGTVKDQEIH